MGIAQKLSQDEGRKVGTDWHRVAELMLISRALDLHEETVLVPQGKQRYQFSARGHDLAQILLGLQLTGRHDAVGVYYRSRPMLLAIGVTAEDALASSMGRVGGYSDGRDIGVTSNFPNSSGASALPMAGGVGTQFTPAIGWAQALEYHAGELGSDDHGASMAVALGGDGSVATNGFWSALTIATTQKLPMLFYIEDNGYGISVPSHFQTPGGDISENLASFKGLTILKGDGTDPAEAARLTATAADHVRRRKGPVLLHLRVPRLMGHSFQDTQAYKPADFVADETARDPLPRLRDYLVPDRISAADWAALEAAAEAHVLAASDAAEARPVPDPARVTSDRFFEGMPAQMGGQPIRADHAGTTDADPQGSRINMVTSIRRVLEGELAGNNRLLVFGEDVGPKGGVHAVTLGLQDKFGSARVFDTSLSEEGIIGRAMGMAAAGLMPCPEIQFRKYADPATEQLRDTGTIRWRTANRFAAPMVVRLAGGFMKAGDPWHSETNEVAFVHSPGWQVAVPSNAEDAAGLLRTALRGQDPVIFFEHRAMLDASWARRQWPGDDYVIPFGKARETLRGDDLTIVTWGAMVPRCEAAAEGRSVSVLDLRTLMPWDSDAVLASVKRTHRCLIVHEDGQTAGFGAESAAVVADRAFMSLDAPVARLTMPDIPAPHLPALLDAAVPSVDAIRAKIDALIGF